MSQKHQQNRCNQAVPQVPMMAFRRPKNLQDYLVRAKLRPVSNSNRGTKGTMHCKSNRCDVCNYVTPNRSFTSYTTKRSYNINHQLDCNSNNVVYLIITCKLCGLQYVGSTSTKFRLRFNNHKIGSQLIPGNLILTKKAMILSISIFLVLDIMDYRMLASRL